jgi:CDP-glucose 4,6-dehydratase
VVSVTSDKCYENREWMWGYREGDAMGGHDPYSNSKGCAELVTSAMRRSFFGAGETFIATARAGNVIGGGDFAEDRLLPDAMRAFIDGRALEVRSPGAIRPWQHVLEPLRGYLLLAEALQRGEAPAAVNFGPADGEIRVRDLLALWGGPVAWEQQAGAAMPEAGRLGLDASLAAQRLGWRPRLTTPAAIAETASWYAVWRAGGDTAAHARATLAAAP